MSKRRKDFDYGILKESRNYNRKNRYKAMYQSKLFGLLKVIAKHDRCSVMSALRHVLRYNKKSLSSVSSDRILFKYCKNYHNFQISSKTKKRKVKKT